MTPEEQELEKQRTALTKLAVGSKLMSDDFLQILKLTGDPPSYQREKEMLRLMERIERTISFIQNTVIEEVLLQDLTPLRD
jgi:hypothetical protein